MPASASNEAVCPGCSRRFRIRTQALGRKVRCDCGTVFEAVAIHPAVLPAVTENDLELDEPAIPEPLMHASSTPIAASASAGPAGPASQPRSQSPVALALLNREDDAAESSLRERWLPIVLLVICWPVHLIVWHLFLGDVSRLVITASIEIAVQLFIFLPAMFGSLVLAARMLDVALGPVPTMLWKMAALVLGPAAVADVLFTATLVLANFDWEIIAAGFGFQLILVGAAAAYLFELSVAQMALFIALNFTVRVAAGYPAAAVLSNLKWID